MFDFGFSELLLIALVALVVVGPERLPKVARTAGHLLGRMQRYVGDVKSDIQREMQLEDLKKLQQQVEQQARDLEHSIRGQAASVEAELGKTAAELDAAVRNTDTVTNAAPDGGTASKPAAVGGAALLAAAEESATGSPAGASVSTVDPVEAAASVQGAPGLDVGAAKATVVAPVEKS